MKLAQRAVLRSALALVVTFGAGCASNSFSLSYPDNEAGALRAVATKIQARSVAPLNEEARIFLVAGKPNPAIAAFDLKTKKVLWRHAGDVTSRVVVGKGFVYHSTSGRRLVARRVTDGTVAWTVSLPQNSRLIGMSTDKGNLYFASEVVKREGGGPAAYLSAVNARGKVSWQRSSKGRIGAPVARDDLVVVPLRYQWISVLDAVEGEEVARVRSKEEALLWVRKTPSGVFFGGKKGVYRLDVAAASGTRAGSTFMAAALPDTVHPSYWRDGYNAAFAGYTALERNRLLWHISGDTFQDRTVYVHNYRYFFAFEGDPARRGRDDATTADPTKKDLKGAAPAAPLDLNKEEARREENAKMAQRLAKSGALEQDRKGFQELDEKGKGQEAGAARLKWAYSFPRVDIVSSYHTGKSLVLVSARGDVVVLDKDSGLVAEKAAVKMSVRGASFDAMGYAAPEKPTGKMDLKAALTEMIWDPDRRFGEVKLFGIQQLAGLKGFQIAKALVQIVMRPGINAKVYKRAGDMIVARHDATAIPLYLDVLKQRYNFVEGTRAGAVDIMARALGDLKAPEAKHPLLVHLADHETPLSAIAPIAAALERLGDKSVVVPLRDFLLTYRCEPQFKSAPAALKAVAKALLAMGGEEERQLLAFVGNDSHTIRSLRIYLKKALQRKQKGTNGKSAKPATGGSAKPATKSAGKKTPS